MRNLVIRRCDCDDQHPQLHLKRLGISYRKVVPQFDRCLFFDCANIPDPLPAGLAPLEGELEHFLGHGLSQVDLNELRGGGLITAGELHAVLHQVALVALVDEDGIQHPFIYRCEPDPGYWRYDTYTDDSMTLDLTDPAAVVGTRLNNKIWVFGQYELRLYKEWDATNA